MCKAFLLATWYNLSDMALAEALFDRPNFRRLCGFARDEETRAHGLRAVSQLAYRCGLAHSLFAAITRELEAKGAIIRKSLPSGSTPRGTIIDAAIIGSAAKGDEEAAWVKHKTRPPAHGYKAHIASQKDTGIIRKAETTPANEADVSIAPSIIPDRPGAVLATRPILRSR